MGPPTRVGLPRGPVAPAGLFQKPMCPTSDTRSVAHRRPPGIHGDRAGYVQIAEIGASNPDCMKALLGIDLPDPAVGATRRLERLAAMRGHVSDEQNGVPVTVHVASDGHVHLGSWAA